MSWWPSAQPPLILCRNVLAGRKPSHGCGGMACRQVLWYGVTKLTASRHLRLSAAKARSADAGGGCMPFLERFGYSDTRVEVQGG